MGIAVATYEDFSKVEIHTDKVTRAEAFTRARKPAIKMWIDFGELGVLTSSAQITLRHTPEGLIGTKVLGVTNFPPRRIAGFSSQVLVRPDRAAAPRVRSCQDSSRPRR